MGRASEAQFGFCIHCKDHDHEACVAESCRCRGTEEHNIVLKEAGLKLPGEEDDFGDLPEGFTWEEPPVQQGRHPLTPQIQRLLKSNPGKFAHVKHFAGKSSAYQQVKNFNAGKYKDLDVGQWELRQVKDGVHGPGSDVYAAYIGD